jgi:hypothetical protein
VQIFTVIAALALLVFLTIDIGTDYAAEHVVASELAAMMEKTCKPNGIEMRHIYGCAEYLK